MRIATLVAGAIMALGMVTVSTPSIAAPVMPKSSIAADSNRNVVDVRHRHGHRHHHHWRHRHFRGPRVIIGPSYGYGNRCGQIRRSCGYNFGWGSRPFHRCVNRRGC